MINKSDITSYINSFNKKSEIVKLQLKEFRSDKYQLGVSIYFVFEVLFDLHDKQKFVETKYYDAGEAFIYLSDKFYSFIDKSFISIFGEAPRWNNTRSIGWVTITYRFN